MIDKLIPDQDNAAKFLGYLCSLNTQVMISEEQNLALIFFDKLYNQNNDCNQ